jgi:CHRD domain
MRSRLLIPALAIGLTGAIASCSDSTSLSENFQDDATWTATLSAEAPGVTSAATGRAFFIDHGNTIDYMIEYSGLTSNATNAHLHTTSNSNVYIQLPFVRQTAGTVFGSIDVSAGVVDVAPTPGPTGNQTVAELRSLLASGGLYVNVHTVNNPGGEIRGTVNPR